MTALDVTGVGPAGPIGGDDPPVSGSLFVDHHAHPLFTPPHLTAPAVVASLGGQLRDGNTPASHRAPTRRVRHELDLDALARVLRAARFAVTVHGRSRVLEAYRETGPGRSVSVLLTPRRGYQYVVYREVVNGVERPMRTEAGRTVGAEWQWHTMRSAVRRALAEVHIAGGAR